MVQTGWQVHLTLDEGGLPAPELPFEADLPTGWASWSVTDEIPARTPFLMSPVFEYDVQLNSFFRSAAMLGSAWNTQAGYARDAAAFLTFLWRSREGKSTPGRSRCRRHQTNRHRTRPPRRAHQHHLLATHFPDIGNQLRHNTRATPATADPTSPGARHLAELEQPNAELTRDNRQLTEHLDLAGANIRRLALDNQHLRQALEASTNITTISR